MTLTNPSVISVFVGDINKWPKIQWPDVYSTPFVRN